MSKLSQEAKRYLKETLGLPVSAVGEWGEASRLPYYLRDDFDLKQVEVAGLCLVLALDKEPERSPAEVEKRMKQLQDISRAAVVYVVPTMPSYNRKRLIERGVEFLVPGNQLYLPHMAMDLREHYRSTPKQVDQLSPSTQAFVIFALLDSTQTTQWLPNEVAARLGYTAMTASRVVREIAATGLAKASKESRGQVITWTNSHRDTWEQAEPLMRSPVQRTLLVRGGQLLPGELRFAGLDALASQTMLSPPKWRISAIARSSWQSLKQGGVEEVPPGEPPAIELQVWSYPPTLIEGPFVDPLSLILSLRDEPDERVQGALDELKETLPW